MNDAPAGTAALTQTAGFYRQRIGDCVLTCLLDGQFEAAFALVVGIDPAEAERLERAASRRTPPRITVNAFLLERAGRRILIDSGVGNAFGPVLGHVPAQLAAAGVQPDQIDTILLTHGHVDHVNGLLDAAGGARYPNAELLLSAAELGFWSDDSIMAAGSADVQQAFQTARGALAPYRARLRTFTGGEVVPGVTAVAEPGHTPGHTGYLIADGAARLLLWGDIVHLPGIQFAQPEAAVAYDVDSAMAVATRRRIMEMAAREQLAVAGMHLDFPTFGHVVKAGTGYAFVPESWTEAP